MYNARVPNINALQADVDAAMEHFANEERRERQQELAKRNLPDEEGFVLVSKAGRKANVDPGGATVHAITAEEASKLKPKDHTLGDFYRFQLREGKRTRNLDLN